MLRINPCLGFPDSSVGKESAYNAGDPGSNPGLGRSPGEGKGYSLQYSGLEKSMDCIVHGVAKSQAQLNDFHFQFLSSWESKVSVVTHVIFLEHSMCVLVHGHGPWPEVIYSYEIDISYPFFLYSLCGQNSLGQKHAAAIVFTSQEWNSWTLVTFFTCVNHKDKSSSHCITVAQFIHDGFAEARLGFRNV